MLSSPTSKAGSQQRTTKGGNFVELGGAGQRVCYRRREQCVSLRGGVQIVKE